jgi:hypothetical protein
MSDIRQYGTGTGGIGLSAVDLTLRGVFETEARMLSMVLENANSPLNVEEVVLASAGTTISVPTQAGGMLVVPAATNTKGILLKGVTGDTGIQLNSTIPFYLPFGSTPPASIFVAWAGSLYDEEAVTADDTTDKIALSAHTILDGDRVTFTGTTLPSGLELGVWYYVVNKATNDFQVSLTSGGAAIDLLSAGTAVKVTSSQHFIFYWI